MNAPSPRPRSLRPFLTLPAQNPLTPTARLLAGDALAVADRLLEEGLAGTFDLVHLDPPFGSEADYGRRRSVLSGQERLELKLPAYGDSDGGDLAGYLDGLYPILSRYHDLLAPHGALYLHLDHRRGPYARLLLDEIFGADNLINQIIWAYGLGGSSRRRFQRKHDVIYFYAKDSEQMHFAPPQEEATSSLLAGQPKMATDTWETSDREDEADLVRGWPDELLRKTLSNRDPERTGYPTQKPLSLATRMILASSRPGGSVLDLMGGSGTVGVAAALLGRRAVIGDRSKIALDVVRARLQETGAAVNLESVHDTLSWRSWPEGQGAMVRLEESNKRTARLCLAALPWPKGAIKGAGAVPDRIRRLAARDGAALWSAWGIATERQDRALESVVRWDGGARRKGQGVPRALKLPPNAPVAESLWWWAVDVLGRCWRGRPQRTS